MCELSVSCFVFAIVYCYDCQKYSIIFILHLFYPMIYHATAKNLLLFNICPDWAPGFFNDFYPLLL